MDDYLYNGMTVYHLGYLAKHQHISTEFKELGVLPYFPEFDSVTKTYLREQEGVLDSNDNLTDEAAKLFEMFRMYDECFWGILILDGFEQEIILDIDEELVEAGLDVAIPNKPRVFFKACVKDSRVAFAVRAGDGVSISVLSSPKGGRHAVGLALHQLCDPESNFSSPKTLAAVSQSKISKVLDGEGMGGFFKRKTVAHAEVLRSTASDNVSKGSAALVFKDGGEACCIGSGVYIDRSTRSWFYEWSAKGIAEALELVSKAPIRRRIDNA